MTEGPATYSSYEDLVVWKRAMDLVDAVYKATKTWPRSEEFGLTNQVRRACVSIPTNIAEGRGRNGRREFLQFLYIARGSLFEVETLISIAERQGFVLASEKQSIFALTGETRKILGGLIKSLRTE